MKVRLRFSKLGKIRFTSHRDVARMWERALRRAGVPVAYSQGFSPRPKLSFGLALSTGHESVAEYLDIDCAPTPERPVEISRLPGLLTPVLPAGIDVQAAAGLPPGTSSLQQAVISCSWRIEVTGREDGDPAELAVAVERLLAADELVITRQRKGHDVTEDVRPAILHLAVVGHERFTAELATEQRGLRPSELIALLGPGFEERQVRRTHQWMQHDGARREPLEVPDADATPAPYAEARAS